MARYPKAVWKPLPENQTQARITPRSFYVHSAAVDSGNVHGYFAQDKVKLESHFFVRWDGTVEQFLDTERRADAQGQANPWAISVETEDDGDPDRQPWSALQMAALIDLIGWACDTHTIPRTLLKKWNGAGVGYHSQFGAPSPLTSVRGKTCPGKVRIRQFLDVVMPAVATPPAPAHAPFEGDLLMPVAKDDNDARQTLIIEWFLRDLNRLPSDDDLALHLWVFARDGAKACRLGIAESEEAKRRRKGR